MIGAGVAAVLAIACAAPATAASFSIPEVLSYPFVVDLVSAPQANRIAWVRMVRGVRNVWVADGPAFTPRQVTAFTADDGEELTQLTFSPDGAVLLFVRGGDHDANWPAKGGLEPDATSSPTQPKVMLWTVDLKAGGMAKQLVEGDAPAISANHTLAYEKDGQIWTAKLDGGDAHRLFFDRGKNSGLAWSPDGSRLAFVSNREDHAFIGVFTSETTPLAWLSPSTGIDGAPVWSADGTKVAFTRRPGEGGPPEPFLKRTPQPWSIWSADAATRRGPQGVEEPRHPARLLSDRGRRGEPALGQGRPPHLPGDYRQLAASLRRARGRRGRAAADAGRVHGRACGGKRRRRDPGLFRQHRRPGRRQCAASPLPRLGERRSAGPLTTGESLEWFPTVLAGHAAYIAADAKTPPAVALVDLKGSRGQGAGRPGGGRGVPGRQVRGPEAGELQGGRRPGD